MRDAELIQSAVQLSSVEEKKSAREAQALELVFYPGL
jgi:hypothetical protein